MTDRIDRVSKLVVALGERFLVLAKESELDSKTIGLTVVSWAGGIAAALADTGKVSLTDDEITDALKIGIMSARKQGNG